MTRRSGGSLALHFFPWFICKKSWNLSLIGVWVNWCTVNMFRRIWWHNWNTFQELFAKEWRIIGGPLPYISAGFFRLCPLCAGFFVDSRSSSSANANPSSRLSDSGIFTIRFGMAHHTHTPFKRIKWPLTKLHPIKRNKRRHFVDRFVIPFHMMWLILL